MIVKRRETKIDIYIYTDKEQESEMLTDKLHTASIAQRATSSELHRGTVQL